jgi:hypothetical protein
MTVNHNAPHFILAVIQRIYPDLPDLVGADWATIKPQVDAHIAKLEATPDAYLASMQLVGLLAEYELANQRFAVEIKIQEVIGQNIAKPIADIAKSLGLAPETIAGLYAAAFSRLAWEVDPDTIPAPDDMVTRDITLNEGGIGRATSVKFKNMRVTRWDFATIAAGFVATGFDITNTPHPLFIAACIILTAGALRDTLNVSLSEQEASVFWGMIQAGKLNLTEADVLLATNKEREQYGLAALNAIQVQHSLTKLEKVKSIEKSGDKYRIIEGYEIKD